MIPGLKLIECGKDPEGSTVIIAELQADISVPAIEEIKERFPDQDIRLVMDIPEATIADITSAFGTFKIRIEDFLANFIALNLAFEEIAYHRNISSQEVRDKMNEIASRRVGGLSMEEIKQVLEMYHQGLEEMKQQLFNKDVTPDELV